MIGVIWDVLGVWGYTGWVQRLNVVSKGPVSWGLGRRVKKPRDSGRAGREGLTTLHLMWELGWIWWVGEMV